MAVRNLIINLISEKSFLCNVQPLCKMSNVAKLCKISNVAKLCNNFKTQTMWFAKQAVIIAILMLILMQP